MEVHIRLQKAGRPASKRYNFRFVVMSKASTRQGRALEILGYYDPSKKPAVISVDQDKVQKWLDRGAIMSDTVRTLVKKAKKV
jgi:small subunit ribosomal protein S16